jgi:hypothetical protein
VTFARWRDRLTYLLGRPKLAVRLAAFLLGVAYGSARSRVPGVRSLVLMGGHGGRIYADNSAYLHRHLVRAGIGNRPATITWMRARTAHGPGDGIRTAVIGSPVSEFLVGASSLLIVSHNVSDVSALPPQVVGRKRILMLSHGVWALKHGNRKPSAMEQAKWRTFDTVVATSPWEANVKAESTGVHRSAIAVTGAPKHDFWVAQGDGREQDAPRLPLRVVYAPTWRDWLTKGAHPVAFEQFFEDHEKFLKDQRVQHLREQELVHVTLFSHVNARAQNTDWQAILASQGAVDATTSDVGIEDALADADMLITDYSSLHWDALAAGKIVSLLAFDHAEYLVRTGCVPGFMIEDLPWFSQSVESTVDWIEHIAALWADGARVSEIKDSLGWSTAERDVMATHLPMLDGDACARLSELAGRMMH